MRDRHPEVKLHYKLEGRPNISVVSLVCVMLGMLVLILLV
jgi:hypothetical protein